MNPIPAKLIRVIMLKVAVEFRLCVDKQGIVLSSHCLGNLPVAIRHFTHRIPEVAVDEQMTRPFSRFCTVPSNRRYVVSYSSAST